ncbi:MAG: Galactose-1-phosphate uridylyltransferase [Syntrophorhabdus sp. PtaU1.Bin058]|nr:MAG: Galactose-1-phosphate uridylyltransferase [Syntrophorhabdus sp. PtaU1.Bin058]
MPELRKDPVSGSWVVVGYHTKKSSSTGICPFCPGNENLTPNSIREYKDPQGNWLVRCFPASNPIFVIEVAANKRAEGIYDKMENLGAHEIIVENRSHTKTMSGFSQQELLLLFDMYRDRILDLKQDMRFKHIYVFKNHGELAGSYIFHPHSHVLATPIVPSGIIRELINAKNHYLQKERCLFCDIISQEIRQNKRVVMMNTNFIAICPFAPRFPYEVWILPRFHEAGFECLTTEGIKNDLALAMLDIMKRIEKLANAYTFVVHTSPNMPDEIASSEDIPVHEYFHWYIEILPRDFRSSKYKREDEFHVVSITPEDAADALRSQNV